MEVDDLSKEIRDEFPKFRIVKKTDSRLMAFLGWFLKYITFGAQRNFITDYVTTIGYTVYVPIAWSWWTTQSKVRVLRHERVHMRQGRRLTMPLYSLLYLFVPLPFGLAWFRARFEKEAYQESIVAIYEQKGKAAILDPTHREWIVKQFVTGAYGWMWPFRSGIEAWYDRVVAGLIGNHAVKWADGEEPTRKEGKH